MAFESSLRGDRAHFSLTYQDLGNSDFDQIHATSAWFEVLDPGSAPNSPRYMKTKTFTLVNLGDQPVFVEEHYDLLSLSRNYLKLHSPDPWIGDETAGGAKDTRSRLHDIPFIRINYHQGDSKDSTVTKVATINDVFFCPEKGPLYRFAGVEGAFPLRVSTVTSMTFNVRGTTGRIHDGDMEFKHFRHDDGFGPTYFPLRSPLQLSADRQPRGDILWGDQKGFEYKIETSSPDGKQKSAYKFLPSGDRDGSFTPLHLPNTRFVTQFERTKPAIDLPLTLQIESDSTNPLFVSALIESNTVFAQQLSPYEPSGKVYNVARNDWLSEKSGYRVTFQAHSTIPGKYGKNVGEPLKVALIELAQNALRQAEGAFWGCSTLSNALRLRVKLTPTGVGEVNALADTESTCAAITRLATGGEPPFHYGETYLNNGQGQKNKQD